MLVLSFIVTILIAYNYNCMFVLSFIVTNLIACLMFVLFYIVTLLPNLTLQHTLHFKPTIATHNQVIKLAYLELLSINSLKIL